MSDNYILGSVRRVVNMYRGLGKKLLKPNLLILTRLIQGLGKIIGEQVNRWCLRLPLVQDREYTIYLQAI